MGLLLEELMESTRSLAAADPLPYFAGVIAARSLLVVNNPLHLMYTKVNKFLNKSPEWNIMKLPSYWIGKILLAPPTEDDAHHREMVWLLDTLNDGLRTSAVRLPCEELSFGGVNVRGRTWNYIAAVVSLKGSCHYQCLHPYLKLVSRRLFS